VIAGAARLIPIVAVLELPLSVAVIVTDSLVVMEPAVAVKLPLVLPAAILTELGVVSAALVSEILTTEPPVGAAWVRVTVHVLEVLGANVAGLHASADSDNDTAGTRLRLVLLELLLYVAVMVALWLLLIVPAVTLNVEELDPAATTTELGTVRTELVSVSITVAPPDGAAPLKVTAQLDVAPEFRLAVEHCNPDTVGRAV
jgi:hypothetical protein